MDARRSNPPDGASLGGCRRRRFLRWAVLPFMAVGLVVASSLPATAQGRLPSERAALGLALAVLSMHQFMAQPPAPQGAGSRHVVARNASPDRSAVAAVSAPRQAIQESQAETPSQPRATAPGGTNRPDDRNLGSGGPTGGTSPAPPGAAEDGSRNNPGASSGSSGSGTSGTGAGGADDKSGAETGGGSDSDNPRSPTPNR